MADMRETLSLSEGQRSRLRQTIDFLEQQKEEAVGQVDFDRASLYRDAVNFLRLLEERSKTING